MILHPAIALFSERSRSRIPKGFPQQHPYPPPFPIPYPLPFPPSPAGWQGRQAFRENPRKTTHFDTPCQPSQKGDIFQGQSPARGRHPPRTCGREDRPLFPRRSVTSPDAARGAALNHKDSESDTPRTDAWFPCPASLVCEEGRVLTVGPPLPVRRRDDFVQGGTDRAPTDSSGPRDPLGNALQCPQEARNGGKGTSIPLEPENAPRGGFGAFRGDRGLHPRNSTKNNEACRPVR